MVGTFGSVGSCAVPNAASGRSFPSLTCGTVATGATMEIGVWPPIVDPIANPALPKGTCTRSMPCDTCNCAPTRCPGEPTPPEAKLFGLALARAIGSYTVFAGRDGWTANTIGVVTAQVIGVEILDWIIGDFVEERGIDHIGVSNDDDGRAVGRCFGCAAYSNIAARAGDVLNVKLLSKMLGQPLSHETAESVGRPARCKRNNDAHRPRGIG